VSLYGLTLTELLDSLMISHLGHLGHFVMAGFLSFWMLVASTPAAARSPRRSWCSPTSPGWPSTRSSA
jgi:hypothetical protein